MTDRDKLNQKLNSELNIANWELLSQHYDRGALVYIDDSLDIIEVGMALAEDNVDMVKDWQKDKKIGDIPKEVLAEWKSDPKKNVAYFLIISPYVVVKELSEKDYQ